MICIPERLLGYWVKWMRVLGGGLDDGGRYGRNENDQLLSVVWVPLTHSLRVDTVT